ncbi:MAG: hypothetical protein ACI81R_002161 [Bradymonadia bacterium]|jgi:hypothetical protein
MGLFDTLRAPLALATLLCCVGAGEHVLAQTGVPTDSVQPAPSEEELSTPAVDANPMDDEEEPPVAAPNAVPAPSGLADDQPMMWVAYEGELLDAQNAPISGVFPLVFSLYRSADSRNPVWVELQWVSIVEGRYDVHLGRTSGVPLAWEGQTRTLAVSLNGGGELTRHDIALNEWRDELELLGARITAAGEVDLAARAITADRAGFARECQTLSGRSANDLNRFAELLARIEEMRGRLNRSGANRIGRETVTLSAIGAGSGRPYQRMCPPGFAMTGIRGGMGQLVDGFRGVCTEIR